MAYENCSEIPARLHVVTEEGVALGANEIVDDALGLMQSSINEDVAPMPYNDMTPDGMGRVIIKKNEDFKTVVESQSTGHTIFYIKYDFDLNGGEVTIPANCVLQFEGGSISNGTIEGDNTTFEAGSIKIFDDIVFSGTFFSNMNALWLGITKDNPNNSQILSDYLNSNRRAYRGLFEIDFPNGSYQFNEPISVVGTVWLPLIIEGNGSFFHITYNTTDTFLKFEGKDELQIRNIYFEGGTIWNNKTVPTKPTCIELESCHYFTLENVKIYNLLCGILLKDCWYGAMSGSCTFQNVMVGVKTDVGAKSFEINNINLAGLTVHGCNRDYIKNIFPQQAGESNDDYALRVATCGLDFHTGSHSVQFRGVCVEGLDYGFRFNAIESDHNSRLDNIINIESCYFEGNYVRDIFIGEGYVYKTTESTYRRWQGGDVAISSCTFHSSSLDYQLFLSKCDARIIGGRTRIRAKVDATTQLFPTRVEYDENVDIDIVGSFFEGRDNTLQTVKLDNSYPKLMKNLPSDNGDVKLMSVGASNCRYDANISFSNDTAAYRKVVQKHTMNVENDMHFQKLFKFVDATYDKDSNSVKVGIISAGKLIRCNALMWASGFVIDPATALFSKSTRKDTITFEEFLAKWDSNQNYTGYVETIFPLSIRTDVANGLVYMTVNGVEKVVAYGKGIWYSTTPALNLDTMCITDGYGESYLRFLCDFSQCCRNYAEVIPDNYSYRKAYLKVNGDYNALIKHLNTIVFDARDASPANHKYKIFNGYDFVELTSRSQRYEYVDNGKSLAQRMLIPDLVGQTYFNKATGITYTYYLSEDKLTGVWMPSIGNVLSLDHPNGYDASTNPITWATELQSDEMVAYQGKIYKFDGTNLVAITS